MNATSQDKTKFPNCGLLILLGDEGKKVAKFLEGITYDSNSYLSKRVFTIIDDKDFEKQLEDVYNSCMLYWAKYENQYL